MRFMDDGEQITQSSLMSEIDEQILDVSLCTVKQCFTTDAWMAVVQRGTVLCAKRGENEFLHTLGIISVPISAIHKLCHQHDPQSLLINLIIMLCHMTVTWVQWRDSLKHGCKN